MKIIVLYGPTNSGKTTTLGMVYTTLISNGAAEITFSVVKDKGNYTDDLEAILGYQGEQIAICSYGDISVSSKDNKPDNIPVGKAKNFDEQVSFFEKKNVDVLVVAYSTGGDASDLKPSSTSKLILIKKANITSDCSVIKSNKDSKEYDTVAEVEPYSITRFQTNTEDCHKIISLI